MSGSMSPVADHEGSETERGGGDDGVMWCGDGGGVAGEEVCGAGEVVCGAAGTLRAGARTLFNPLGVITAPRGVPVELKTASSVPAFA